MNYKISKREWVGFFLILIIYALFNQLYIDTKFFRNNTNTYKFLFELTLIFIIAFTGFLSLRGSNLVWRLTLWTFTYISGLTLFLLFFLMNIFFYKVTTNNGQYRLNSFFQILASPIPYVLLVLLSKLNSNHRD